jgi:hypothetical protein
VSPAAYCRGISQPGEQYALYLHHSELEPNYEYYVVKPGHHHETLTLDLPGGTYKAEWVDPASGSVVSTVTFTHGGGSQNLTAPEYTVDIALRIKRIP